VEPATYNYSRNTHTPEEKSWNINKVSKGSNTNIHRFTFFFATEITETTEGSKRHKAAIKEEKKLRR